jgi:tetratricopeptide (TPR) repeat protein
LLGRRLNMTIFLNWKQWRAGLLACAVAAASSIAWAQTAPYAQVQRLIGAEQFDQALAVADGWLQNRPSDPQMRLLKSVIQSQTQQTQAALDTLTAITQEFPELPEPYNNLAVLHAQAGDLQEARLALEMALRINPAYSTAQRNLGDVYVQLALQAYQQAKQPELASRIDTLQQLTPKR